MYFLVRSCLLITLIKCLKGHMSQDGSLMSKSKRSMIFSQLITGVTCVQNNKSLRALSDSVFQQFNSISTMHCNVLNGRIDRNINNKSTKHHQKIHKMAISRSSQNVFVFVFVIFFGHVMSSHHSDQMSQRSQVFRVAL